KYGRFYVPGNHEYYWNGGADLFAKIAALGFTMLFNENELLNIGGQSLAIAGVTDPAGEHMLQGHAPDMKRAAAGIQNAAVKILKLAAGSGHRGLKKGALSVTFFLRYNLRFGKSFALNRVINSLFQDGEVHAAFEFETNSRQRFRKYDAERIDADRSKCSIGN